VQVQAVPLKVRANNRQCSPNAEDL